MKLAWTMGLLLGLALGGCGDGMGGTDGGGSDGGGTSDAGGGMTDGGGGTDGGGTTDDAGGTDGGGGMTDGGGGMTDAGACVACLASSYEFGPDGGLVRERRRSRLDPCRDFVHTRTGVGSGGGIVMCENQVPSCDDPSGPVSVDRLVQAFAHPDVVAAFAAAPVVYGRDTRPVDGQVFEIVEGAGAAVAVGSDCAGEPSCTPIPPGVAALRDLLQQLEVERLAGPDCATTFPGG